MYKIVWFLNVSFSETFWPIFTRFYMGPSFERVLKICSMVLCHWTRWPPCPYMVETLKNLLLQNQESFEAKSWYIHSIGDSRSTNFVQMMVVGWPLTFLWQDQICTPIHLYGENVKKLFSQTAFKTNGWNLQYLIKVVKYFSYSQNFVPCSLSVLALGLYTCIRLCNFLNVFFSKTAWGIFTRFHMGPSVERLFTIFSNGQGLLRWHAHI